MVLATGLLAYGQATAHSVRQRLTMYTIDYHTLHSDLDVAKLREAALRLRTMAEEYSRRLESMGLRAPLRKRMPVYMPANRADYITLVGRHGAASAGLYRYEGNDGALFISGNLSSGALWHTVQHEGWHQFAHVKLGQIPIWVNEGLAEYFGNGIWTGDNMVTGDVSDVDLLRIQRAIKDNAVQNFGTFISMDGKQWLADMGTQRGPMNYLQAWAMCHFLGHADEGKYREAFGTYIRALGRDVPSGRAFVGAFGKDVDGFARRFAEWWLSQKPGLGQTVRTQAAVETLTSFLLRGARAGKTYDSAEAFLEACKDGSVCLSVEEKPELWLPRSLLDHAMRVLDGKGTWELKGTLRRPMLVFTADDGTVYKGTGRAKQDNRFETDVEVLSPPAS